MRELEAEKTYEGKILFSIVPHTKAGFADEVASFDIGNHGLVGFDPQGKVGTKIPGHEFGKAEIVKAIKTLLGEVIAFFSFIGGFITS